MKCYYMLSLFSVTVFIFAKEENYYELLGISKDANVKDIRRAFKNLAVKLHPDKNKNDKYAQEKFVKLAQAYETLKEPETRKLYDLYGETQHSHSSNKAYHSYTYYRDEFGIYDDDPLIVTLSRTDYEINILDNHQSWFVNFYSPHCHHCHKLAPIWRKLAQELEGVIRIGAVNCEEDRELCSQLNIGAYPTLLYYEKEAHLHEGKVYRGAKTSEGLKDFVLSQLDIKVKHLIASEWTNEKNKQWLLFLCADNSPLCPEHEIEIKLAAILEGLMSVAKVTDSDLCDEIFEGHKESHIVLWNSNESDVERSSPQVHVVSGSDTKEIVDKILSLMPNPIQLDDDKFREIRADLHSGFEKPWLICFFMGSATELNLQLKRLPMLVPHINIGMIQCGRYSVLCGSLHVSHYPTWGVLKEGGAFELHHGRDTLNEVAAFARDSVRSTNFHALSPADFQYIQREGSVWFIDWYAPWCPPCRRLMPELRRASLHFTPDAIKFGTIDCTQHSQLCSQEGIRSYPTTMMYNGSKVQFFHGSPNEDTIVEFVQDMLNPTVITLDENSFIRLLRKPKNEMWIVDYFAPWCRPCQMLAPQLRTLAKQLISFEQVKIAQVDCEANVNLCNAQNIKSYPTIRMYPLDSKGLNSVIIYNGQRDAVNMKRWVVGFLPSPVVALSAKTFRAQILIKRFYLPWLIDFYAPWCSHCVHFEPDFITVAQKLQGKVRTGKVDCESERSFCRELRITSYPTIVLYLSPNERHNINSQVPKEIIVRVKEIIAERSIIHDEF